MGLFYLGWTGVAKESLSAVSTTFNRRLNHILRQLGRTETLVVIVEGSCVITRIVESLSIDTNIFGLAIVNVTKQWSKLVVVEVLSWGVVWVLITLKVLQEA